MHIALCRGLLNRRALTLRKQSSRSILASHEETRRDMSRADLTCLACLCVYHINSSINGNQDWCRKIDHEAATRPGKQRRQALELSRNWCSALRCC